MIGIPALLGFAIFAPASVSVATLLPQMTDMTFLTRPPVPSFTMAQASSYDRRFNPGQDEFANADAGNFVRTEDHAGRKEYVLADLKGPGAVVRFWSANPAGQVRFYFDGETEPRLSAKLADLLTGKVAPFVDPFAYKAAQGCNLYFPFPYQKGLKITVDDTDENRAQSLYYHVGYRTYGQGTSVETFDSASLLLNQPGMDQTAEVLLHPDRGIQRGTGASTQRKTLDPSKSWSVATTGAGTVRTFSVKVLSPAKGGAWSDPTQLQNVLRNVLLSVRVGGQMAIRVPLGDFFGTTAGLNIGQTFPFTVSRDGTMTCRLPMPFRKGIRFDFENIGSVSVPLQVKTLIDPTPPPADSYALHAQWQAYRGMSRPFREMNFLTAKGEGMWVGSNLHIANSSRAWWGEGDEKAFVDGESFPSTFGTGTEDYYGYAWSSPELFSRPYHSQARCDGPGTFGHSDVNRFQILDPIPFRKSMKFDLELWHWEDVPVTFAYTSYWYAPAGSQPPVAINRALLLPPELVPPAPVKGALEGESLKVLGKTGGSVENQTGFWETSGSSQLWWTNAVEKDQLTLEVPVKAAGRYEIIGHFCHAKDYGIHAFQVNGKEGPKLDFFAPTLNWKRVSLGTYDLPAGTSKMTITCRGRRDEAIPGQMLGLDYLLVEKK